MDIFCSCKFFHNRWNTFLNTANLYIGIIVVTTVETVETLDNSLGSESYYVHYKYLQYWTNWNRLEDTYWVKGNENHDATWNLEKGLDPSGNCFKHLVTILIDKASWIYSRNPYLAMEMVRKFSPKKFHSNLNRPFPHTIKKKITNKLWAKFFLTFPVGFYIPTIYSNWIINVIDLRNLLEQVKKPFWSKNCTDRSLFE